VLKVIPYHLQLVFNARGQHVVTPLEALPV
jgi:hypothetical protein